MPSRTFIGVGQKFMERLFFGKLDRPSSLHLQEILSMIEIPIHAGARPGNIATVAICLYYHKLSQLGWRPNLLLLFMLHMNESYFNSNHKGAIYNINWNGYFA
ncbi:uncharacterized protein LOC109009343 [Juglans regia]|uniref:Uncharacterized protein LOC109009343 n=1 Tax=Juglans regia TaxID=51240 RepID=A0A2I4GN61_JUGRE|nr:uncharacterized protein LOC109009343 [Juglans regia]